MMCCEEALVLVLHKKAIPVEDNVGRRPGTLHMGGAILA